MMLKFHYKSTKKMVAFVFSRQRVWSICGTQQKKQEYASHIPASNKRLFPSRLIGYGQSCSSFGTTGSQYFSSILGCHSRKEPVFVSSLSV
jgi:hypothetical protein